MGAWGPGIFDSDAAFDVIDQIEVLTGLRGGSGEPHGTIGAIASDNVRDALNTHMPLLTKTLLAPMEVVILCALVLQNGAALTDELRQATVDALAIQREDYLFPEAVDHLTTAMQSYNGTPVAFAVSNLMDVIAEH